MRTRITTTRLFLLFLLIPAFLISPPFARISTGQDIDMQGFVDDMSKTLSDGFKMWMLTIRFQNVIINGPSGILPNGGLVSTNPVSIFETQLNTTGFINRNEPTRKLEKAVVKGIREALKMWASLYVHTSLQFTMGAACPGPVLPPTANIPVLVSTGSPKSLSGGTINTYIVSELGHLPTSNSNEDKCYKNTTKIFVECFDIWKNIALIKDIMGQGGMNPLWVPPAPRPGPVVSAFGLGGTISGNFLTGAYIKTRLKSVLNLN